MRFERQPQVRELGNSHLMSALQATILRPGAGSCQIGTCRRGNSIAISGIGPPGELKYTGERAAPLSG